MLNPLILLVGIVSAVAAVPDIVGRASVVDGDTFDIDNVRVRLHGIDAPESWQRCLDSAGQSYRCGKVAADALDRLLAASRPVRCEFRSFDRNRRFVGQCFRADGQDVAALLVRAGHLRSFPDVTAGEASL